MMNPNIDQIMSNGTHNPLFHAHQSNNAQAFDQNSSNSETTIILNLLRDSLYHFKTGKELFEIPEHSLKLLLQSLEKIPSLRSSILSVLMKFCLHWYSASKFNLPKSVEAWKFTFVLEYLQRSILNSNDLLWVQTVERWVISLLQEIEALEFGDKSLKNVISRHLQQKYSTDLIQLFLICLRLNMKSNVLWELFSEIYSPQSIWIIGVIGIHFPETVFDFLFQVVKLKHQEINFLSAITNQDGVFVPPTPQLLNIELTIQILEFLIEKSPKQISFSSVRILINLLENFNYPDLYSLLALLSSCSNFFQVSVPYILDFLFQWKHSSHLLENYQMDSILIQWICNSIWKDINHFSRNSFRFIIWLDEISHPTVEFLKLFLIQMLQRETVFPILYSDFNVKSINSLPGSIFVQSLQPYLPMFCDRLIKPFVNTELQVEIQPSSFLLSLLEISGLFGKKNVCGSILHLLLSKISIDHISVFLHLLNSFERHHPGSLEHSFFLLVKQFPQLESDKLEKILFILNSLFEAGNFSDYQVDFLGNYYLQFFSLVYYPNLNLDYIFQLLQYFNLPSSAQNAFIIIDKLVLYLLSLFKSYETNFQTNFIQKRLIEKTKQLVLKFCYSWEILSHIIDVLFDFIFSSAAEGILRDHKSLSLFKNSNGISTNLQSLPFDFLSSDKNELFTSLNQLKTSHNYDNLLEKNNNRNILKTDFQKDLVSKKLKSNITLSSNQTFISENIAEFTDLIRSCIQFPLSDTSKYQSGIEILTTHFLTRVQYSFEYNYVTKEQYLELLPKRSHFPHDEWYHNLFSTYPILFSILDVLTNDPNQFNRCFQVVQSLLVNSIGFWYSESRSNAREPHHKIQQLKQTYNLLKMLNKVQMIPKSFYFLPQLIHHLPTKDISFLLLIVWKMLNKISPISSNQPPTPNLTSSASIPNGEQSSTEPLEEKYLNEIKEIAFENIQNQVIHSLIVPLLVTTSSNIQPMKE